MSAGGRSVAPRRGRDGFRGDNTAVDGAWGEPNAFPFPMTTTKTIATGLGTLIAALLLAPQCRAEVSNAALLDLLVRKHLISQKDVDSLRAEIAPAPAQKAPDPAVAVPPAQAAVPAAVCAPAAPKQPLSFRIGTADFTPFGFVDFTGFFRTRATGSNYPTAFTSIPYSNTPTGGLSETKFTAQNSRFGIRVESMVEDTKVLGYVETDFLGNAPSNLGVSSNSATLRMRSYFADLSKGRWELLFGQDWSLMTPNRRGISPVTPDIFYTNDMDGNYQAGLTWCRQAQVRVVYHATDELTLAASAEDPDQFVGSAVTLPGGFTASEVDSGSATTQPNEVPDLLAKAAFDTKVGDGLPWHAEVAGVLRTFKICGSSGSVASDSTAEGWGASGAVSLGITKTLTLVGTGYYGLGGGRYIGGNSPDFVVEGPGSSGPFRVGLLRSTSSLVGLEWAAAACDTVSAYWSTIGTGRRFSQQANGAYVGYGYPGSPSSNNRSVEEFTLANTYTLWRSPSYGALQVIGQLSEVERSAWYQAPGSPARAEDTMVFVDLRYVLP